MSLQHQCPFCNRPNTMSAAVVVISLWAPKLNEPYPLVPAMDYNFCLKDDCRGAAMFVNSAQISHSATARAGPWTYAIVTTKDRQSYHVTPPTQATQAPADA